VKFQVAQLHLAPEDRMLRTLKDTQTKLTGEDGKFKFRVAGGGSLSD
jgi:hypothetical protein